LLLRRYDKKLSGREPWLVLSIVLQEDIYTHCLYLQLIST
jgi:hypothetical protein